MLHKETFLLPHLIFASDDDESPGLVLALPLQGHVDDLLRHGVAVAVWKRKRDKLDAEWGTCSEGFCKCPILFCCV